MAEVETILDDTVRLIHMGVALEIPRYLMTPVIAESFHGGGYEAQEARTVSAMIEKGERVLELGSGVGFIAAIAKKNPLTECVFAVEANPSLLSVMRRTFELNQVNVSAFNEILGARDGETEFRIRKNFWASSSHEDVEGEPIMVRTSSFQKRLRELQPTMLIIDIEGSEVSLFDDIDLYGVEKIVLEFHQGLIGGAGIAKVFMTLAEQGFHYDQDNSAYSVVAFRRI